MRGETETVRSEGFTLVEVLISMLILCFGLMAAGQMIFVSVSSGSLSRSMDGATVAAQDKLEFLTNLYNQNPNSGDLLVGLHGPDQVQVMNQATNTVLNRFTVSWTVATVADPRPGKLLKAKQVTVTVTPVNVQGTRHVRTGLNKVVTMSAIFSLRTA